MDVTVMTWVVAVLGLLIIGLLGSLQLVAVLIVPLGRVPVAT